MRQGCVGFTQQPMARRNGRIGAGGCIRRQRRLREWRVKHGRERVPRDVMEKMVREAVAESAQAFSVSASQIDVDSVYWNARKTGRFVVRR